MFRMSFSISAVIWQEVIDAANEVGCPYMFVEQDFSVHPKYECLELSKKYLETLDGLMME